MGDTTENLKQMVYNTLLESKKPLMAKKIAYNIYQKYNGFKMSRFVVRDVLWKELTGQFEYDNVNYTYKIIEKDIKIAKNKSNETIVKKTIKKINLSEGANYSDILQAIRKTEGKDILGEFKNWIKSTFLNVNTGDKRFDQLIASVVKDNKITRNEEVFLKQKTSELGLPYDLIEKAKEMLDSNNPYLDNIIHIIFEDGEIKEEELLFLKEKESENNFSQSFVNQRFWQIGICYYLNELNQLNNFNKVIKLWHFGITTGFEFILIDTWLLSMIDIHSNNNIEEIITNGVKVIEGELIKHISEKYNIMNTHIIDHLYREINLTHKSENLLIKDEKNVSYLKIIKILHQEKNRLGSPDVNLLVENVKYRIENELWD